MKKLIMSLFICAIMSTLICVPAFATEETSDNHSVKVEYIADDSYTALIPAYIMAKEQGEFSADYSVTVENVILPERNILSATVEYSGSLVGTQWSKSCHMC